MSGPIHNILVITSWSFNDALIQTYTLPYLLLIKKNLSSQSKIFLYTQSQYTPKTNIDVYQQQKEELKKQNIFIIENKYKPFGFLALFSYVVVFFRLWHFCISNKITVLHTWCTPAGGMGYLLARVTNIKLILDSFEPHALPMVETNTWSQNSFAFKLLSWLEKKQLQGASEVICTTEGMIENSKQKYGVIKKRYFIKPACVDLNHFSVQKIKNPLLIKEFNLENKITCVYAGKFGGLYLKHETFDFFKCAYDYWGEKFRILLLTSHTDKEIQSYLESAGLPNHILIKKFVPFKEVAEYMGLADFAICPTRPGKSRKYCTPIKTGEYWAMSLPVVITKDISTDSDIIKRYGIGSVLEELNAEAYLNAVKSIDEILTNGTRMDIFHKIRPIAEKYRNFDIADQIYQTLYGNTDINAADNY
ncbi:MAG: glycosyltransferase [Bacteroidetes bacterium]|nr:glycosyltransferase [Bacteroidota bacterium]